MTETEHHTFDEVPFQGELLELNATEWTTWIDYRPATRIQPPEGGYWETVNVEATSVVVERGGELVTLKRPLTPDAWWKQLDDIAGERVDQHNETTSPV